MAVLGRTARAQVVQIVRNHVFRSTTQTGLDRIRSTSMRQLVPAATVWEDFSREIWSVKSRGFATQGASSSEAEEDKRVESQVREELGEPEGSPVPGVKDKAKQAVSKVGAKVKDAGKAIKTSTGSKTVENVGDTVEGAGDSIENKGAKQQRLGNEDVVTS